MKKVTVGIAIILLVGSFILSPQQSFSFTTVQFDDSGVLTDVVGLGFTILSPQNVINTNFIVDTTTQPTWINFALGGDPKDVSLLGFAPLTAGLVGAFTNFSQVTLNAWSLSDSNANSLTNFIVSYNTQNDTYTVSAVPIPAAVWLLGSGVVGLVVLKRRKRA